MLLSKHVIRLKQDALFVNDLLEKIYHNVDVSGHLFNSIVSLVSALSQVPPIATSVNKVCINIYYTLDRNQHDGILNHHYTQQYCTFRL